MLSNEECQKLYRIHSLLTAESTDHKGRCESLDRLFKQMFWVYDLLDREEGRLRELEGKNGSKDD